MFETTDVIDTPAEFLAQLYLRLGQTGPAPGLLESLLAACRRWPENSELGRELLLLLQELPAQALPLPVIHDLSQWLATEFLNFRSDLQPYAGWLQLCLRPLPAWEELARESRELMLPTQLPALFSEPLFALLLLCTCLMDPELEITLTCLRGQLLAAADRLGPEWEPVLLMLACQAFNNGYVWGESNAETRALEALPSQRADVIGLLLIGCYRRLQMGQPDIANLQQRSPLWQRLLQVSVLAPLRETQLMGELTSLTPPAEDQACFAFYEETPYPSWFAPERLAVEPLGEQLAALFPFEDWSSRLRPEMDVLIAGCGTGQQLVQHALQQPDARMTGIDLSPRALGYAARMLQDAGLTAELYQADLLQLGRWPRSFDLIACGGVLQHLADPEAGLANLVKLLKPGGLLKLGVYSARAHAPVDRLRHQMGIKGGESPAELRRLRQHLLTDNSLDARWLRQTRDFYALPTCRDLLCHPRETCFGLPELAGWFSRQRLRVIGFELWNPQHYHVYRERFPDDPTMTNLIYWDRLESGMPWLFAGMIVVWLEGMT